MHTFLHIAIHFFSAHYDFLKNYLLQENIPSNCLLSMPWCFLGYFLWLVSIRNMFLRCSRALVFCFLFFSLKELVFLITVSYKTYCVYAMKYISYSVNFKKINNKELVFRISSILGILILAGFLFSRTTAKIEDPHN